MITKSDELLNLCEKIKNCPAVALDTEFIREESYLPRLETIQVCAGDTLDIIDFPIIKDMTPFWEIMTNSNVEKIVHSGSQDLMLLYLASGQPVRNVFDTQIAAAFVGLGEQIGYGQLVKQLAGVTLLKSQSYSAWGIRPLSQEQIEYALDDVRYLPELASALKKRISELNREAWLKEELTLLENSPLQSSTPLEELYTKVRGADNLEPKELVILRELTIWREEEAQRKNKMPQRLLRDELLISLARRPVQSSGELRRMRGFPPMEVDRLGNSIINAIKKAQSIPKEDWPQKLKSHVVEPSIQAAASVLNALVRAKAVQESISWGLLTSTQELEQIAELKVQSNENGFRVLTGWRYDLIGKDILRMLDGELFVGYDKTAGCTTIINKQP